MGKLGIAFGGGGGKGAYQIGVWRALAEFGIASRIDVFSGCSIGSINAALLSAGDYDKALETWSTMEQDDVIPFNRSIIDRIKEHKFHIFTDGLFDTKNIGDLFDSKFNYDAIAKREVYVSVSNSGRRRNPISAFVSLFFHHKIKKENRIKNVLLKYRNGEDIKGIIMASCSIPVVFPAVKHKENHYFDGGILNNMPIRALLKAGCNTIISVDLYRFFHKSKLDVPKNVNVVRIIPSKSLKSILRFDKELNKKRIELGYKDALKVLQGSNIHSLLV